jgi:hypothetical protein
MDHSDKPNGINSLQDPTKHKLPIVQSLAINIQEECGQGMEDLLNDKVTNRWTEKG